MSRTAQLVIDHFFQLFYAGRIEILKTVGRQYYQQIDVALLLFWFSVIDFYGGIYWVGKNNKIKTQYDGSKKILKLANKETFALFVNDFFPTPENQLGNLLYSVFRSGLVHQLTPKKGGIVWDEADPRLLWVTVDRNNEDPITNKVAFINIFQLERMGYEAYSEFKRKVESGELEPECAAIHKWLIDGPDLLGDGYVLNREYAALSPVLSALITV